MSINEIKNLKTIKEVDEYRKKMNEVCDKRAALISTYHQANTLSEKDFGTIKESFEAISPALFKTEGGKKIIQKYTKTIKESKNLSSLHTLYENIRRANKDSDVDFFISSIAEENWNVNPKTLAEDCKRLGRVLAEGYILVADKCVDLPKENAKLSNAVTFIAENKKSTKNIADYSNAMKIIRETIENNDVKANTFETVDLDTMVKEAVESFNKKYSSQLNEGEVDALKEICVSENKEDVFNRYKDTCIKKLSEAKEKYVSDGNDAASEKIQTIMEQISEKSFSVETVGNDVCSLIELTNIF